MRKKLIVLSTLTSFLFIGCSSTPEPVVEQTPKETTKICVKQAPPKIFVKHTKIQKKPLYRDMQLQYPKVLYTKSTSINTDTIDNILKNLTEQLEKNSSNKSLKDFHLFVSPLKSLDNSDDNSHFRSIFQEKLVHEMQKKGYKVYNNQKNIFFTLVGTCIKLNKGMLVSVKVIHNKTNGVLSTAQVLIPSRELKRL